MICKNCGKNNTEGVPYCAYCGKPLNIQDDMLSLKMAENFLRLITQSKQAKDYVIQGTGDVYTKVLHHRRQFV